MPVIVKPVSRRSSLTSAVVSTRFGCRPAFSRLSVSAIEKQPASAAPMSSSGLLPASPSKRVPAENVASGACAPFIVPLPSLKPPCHVADALLMAMSSSPCESLPENPQAKHVPARRPGKRLAASSVHSRPHKKHWSGRKAPPSRTNLGEYFQMRAQLVRVLVVLTCLVFGAVGVSSRAAAADKKKSWPSKKHHHKTHHRSGRSAKPSSKSAAPGTSAAPAEETDDDDSDESAEQDDKQTDDSKAKPSKTKGKGARDDEASDDKGKGKGKGDDDEEEDGSDAGVLHRKARKPSVAEEGGAAPAAVELAVGPRIIHRSFSFNDPLSNYNPSAAKPYSYVLPGGPAPFVTLGLYPAAFATRGFASNIGLVASYEKLLGTKTMAADGSTFTTFAQQFEVGARVRVPLGGNEVGVSGTYGKQ